LQRVLQKSGSREVNNSREIAKKATTEILSYHLDKSAEVAANEDLFDFKDPKGAILSFWNFFKSPQDF